MPSNWLYVDTNFPTFTGEESPNEKITTILNYMFMLVEQLRYTLHNLDLSNMNSTAVEQYGTSLTDPIYARIEDEEGDLAQLALTAQGLALQISDAEGNIGALQLTATALTSRISDAEGNISTLQQTASSLYSQISDAQGDISTLYQTAASLGSRISDAEGNISTLQQTAASLTSRISDAEGNISTLQQTASSLTSLISDAQGDISVLQQTASGLASRVSDAEGNISALTQTVNGFGLSVSSGTSSTRVYLTSNGITVDSVDISFPEETIAKQIANGTYTSGTFINGVSVTSPNIMGGKIYGADFYGNTFNIYPNVVDSDGSFNIYGKYDTRTLNMLQISYKDGIPPYVYFTSPAKGAANFNFSRMQLNSTSGIDFYGTVDFSEATITGLDYGETLPSSGKAGQVFFKI